MTMTERPVFHWQEPTFEELKEKRHQFLKDIHPERIAAMTSEDLEQDLEATALACQRYARNLGELIPQSWHTAIRSEILESQTD